MLVPRETPLSSIHLQAMLTLRQAGALMLPAMPAFYTLPDSLDDIVDFVAGKALDLLGVEHDLLRRWGQTEHGGGADDARHPRAARGRADVRPHRRAIRHDEPRDDGWARSPLARARCRGDGSRQRGERARRVLWHGRPRARARPPRRPRRPGDRPRLLGRDARARPQEAARGRRRRDHVGAGRRDGDALRGQLVLGRDDRLRAAQPARSGGRACASSRASCARAAGSWCSRSRSPRRAR